MNNNDGGPAFPSHGSMGEVAQEGMTLRDYFMAHAPDHPHPWFTPVMPPCPDQNIWVSEDGMRRYTNHQEAEKQEGENFMRLHHDAIEAWNTERDKQRFVQWPAAWADEQLKARTK